MADDGGVPTPEISQFGVQVVEVLARRLGSHLVGVYFVGSVALGGYVPGESDIDIARLLVSAMPHHRVVPGLQQSAPRDINEDGVRRWTADHNARPVRDGSVQLVPKRRLERCVNVNSGRHAWTAVGIDLEAGTGRR
jgi:tRNA nucleotidyltransferase (CCA-adding enzyme)